MKRFLSIIILGAIGVIGMMLSNTSAKVIEGTVYQEISKEEYETMKKEVVFKHDLGRSPVLEGMDDDIVFVKLTQIEVIENIPMEYGVVFAKDREISEEVVRATLAFFYTDTYKNFLYNYNMKTQLTYYNMEPHNNIYISARSSVDKKNKLIGDMDTIQLEHFNFTYQL